MFKKFKVFLLIVVVAAVSSTLLTSLNSASADPFTQGLPSNPELNVILVLSESCYMNNEHADPHRQRIEAAEDVIRYLTAFYHDFLARSVNGLPPKISIAAVYFQDNVAVPLQFANASGTDSWIDLSRYFQPGTNHTDYPRLKQDFDQWIGLIDSYQSMNFACDPSRPEGTGGENYVTTIPTISGLLNQLGSNPDRRVVVTYLSSGFPCGGVIGSCDYPGPTTSIASHTQAFGHELRNASDNWQVYMLGMGRVLPDLQRFELWNQVGLQGVFEISSPQTQLYPTLLGIITNQLTQIMGLLPGIQFYYINDRGLLDINRQPSFGTGYYHVLPLHQILRVATAFSLNNNPANGLQIQTSNPNQQMLHNSSNPTQHLFESPLPQPNYFQIWDFPNPYPDTARGWMIYSANPNWQYNLMGNDGIFIFTKPTGVTASINQTTAYQFDPVSIDVTLNPPYPIADYGLSLTINATGRTSLGSQTETLDPVVAGTYYQKNMYLRFGANYEFDIQVQISGFQTLGNADEGIPPIPPLPNVEVVPVTIGGLSCPSTSYPGITYTPQISLTPAWLIPNQPFDLDPNINWGPINVGGPQPSTPLLSPNGTGIVIPYPIEIRSAPSYDLQINPLLPDGYPFLQQANNCHIQTQFLSVTYVNPIRFSVNDVNPIAEISIDSSHTEWVGDQPLLVLYWNISAPNGAPLTSEQSSGRVFPSRNGNGQYYFIIPFGDLALGPMTTEFTFYIALELGGQPIVVYPPPAPEDKITIQLVIGSASN